MLNPDLCKSMLVNETPGLKLQDLPQPRLRRPVLQDFSFILKEQQPMISLSLDSSATEAYVSILLKPGKDFAGKDFPVMTIMMDGKEVKAETEKEKGLWAWFSIPVTAGSHVITLNPAKETTWAGTAQAWFLCKSPSFQQSIVFSPVNKFKDRVMPPKPVADGIFEHHYEMGEKEIQFKP